MTHPAAAPPAPALRVHPAHLPRFWDRSAVFVANLRSLFYGNRRQTEILAEQIKGIDSYGGRLLPLIDLLFTGSPNLLVLEPSRTASCAPTMKGSASACRSSV